jgi:hypothetical protein
MVCAFARRLASSSSFFPPPSQPFTPLLSYLHASSSRAFPLLLVLDGVSGPGTTRYGLLTWLVIGRILLSLICYCYLFSESVLNLSVASM